MRSLMTIFIMFISVGIGGCIANSELVKREAGTPLKKHWVVVCPKCKNALDYMAWRCHNPDCRILISWQDKAIYAKIPYSARPQRLPPQELAPAVDAYPEDVEVESKVKADFAPEETATDSAAAPTDDFVDDEPVEDFFDDERSNEDLDELENWDDFEDDGLGDEDLDELENWDDFEDESY